MRRYLITVTVLAGLLGGIAPRTATAQGESDGSETQEGITPPADYVIGADDVLGILFWRDEALSGDVIVRPDGKITVPLLNEIQAAGLTTEELRVRLTEAAESYLDNPNVTVVVRQINSRKIYITGMISGPGTYPLSSAMTVMQLIAMAGGLLEYAKEKDIVIMRFEDGVERIYEFNYRDVRRGKNLQQNIRLQPGDTVVVP